MKLVWVHQVVLLQLLQLLLLKTTLLLHNYGQEFLKTVHSEVV
jgi:hypothetical protein